MVWEEWAVWEDIKLESRELKIEERGPLRKEGAFLWLTIKLYIVVFILIINKIIIKSL